MSCCEASLIHYERKWEIWPGTTSCDTIRDVHLTAASVSRHWDHLPPKTETGQQITICLNRLYHKCHCDMCTKTSGTEHRDYLQHSISAALSLESKCLQSCIQALAVDIMVAQGSNKICLLVVKFRITSCMQATFLVLWHGAKYLPRTTAPLFIMFSPSRYLQIWMDSFVPTGRGRVPFHDLYHPPVR